MGHSGLGTWRRAASVAAALVAGGALTACSGPATATAAAPNLRVVGNRLVDGPGAGHTVRLLGVNRSGLEYACIQGWGFFQSPHPDQIDDRSMLAAMKSWRINVVRVPLNEDCWLGINTPAGRGGHRYRALVKRYVASLHHAGFYVIVDLHTAAPGSTRSVGVERMADADHAPDFWRSAAATFKNDHALIFDLYNEPNHISWKCWRDGCEIPAYDDGYGPQPAYRAAGMVSLVAAVRATGARQPLLIGGTGYSGDIGGWLSHAPHDPRHSLIAAEHNYGGLSPCDASCKRAVLRTSRRHPVVFGELGETDCAHGYIDDFMSWADSHRLGYLGWAWDATSPGGWDCSAGPALITDYAGTPTPFGVGFRDHFRALAAVNAEH